MHPRIRVVRHLNFDYDFTTTHGIELHCFALICKKCSFRKEKYDARKSR